MNELGDALLRLYLPWMGENEGWLDLFIDWLLFTGLPIVLLWAVAHLLVRRHRRDLATREAAPGRPQVTSLTRPPAGRHEAQLVYANVVISHAAVRSLPVLLRRLVGGRIAVLQRMTDRARREALLRLEAEARRLGADRIVGLRFAAQAIGVGESGGYLGVEILVYGTALRPRRA